VLVGIAERRVVVGRSARQPISGRAVGAALCSWLVRLVLGALPRDLFGALPRGLFGFHERVVPDRMLGEPVSVSSPCG
jgi:hypothetical protein